MTQDEIIRMAQGAGFSEQDAMGRPAFLGNIYDLERFAALVAAHEREACAKVCEEVNQAFNKERRYDEAYGAEDCTAAIRAKGK